MEQIPRVCGPMHAMLTWIKFFYKIADLQSLMNGA